jgi:hypothetical protein
MLAVPETPYAVTGDGNHIAYQIVGEEPLDIVVCRSISIAASGSKMACRSPRNMIVAKENLRHSLGAARAGRVDASTDPWTPTSSVRACLYLSLPCGNRRDCEGT